MVEIPSGFTQICSPWSDPLRVETDFGHLTRSDKVPPNVAAVAVRDIALRGDEFAYLSQPVRATRMHASTRISVWAALIATIFYGAFVLWSAPRGDPGMFIVLIAAEMVLFLNAIITWWTCLAISTEAQESGEIASRREALKLGVPDTRCRCLDNGMR